MSGENIFERDVNMAHTEAVEQDSECPVINYENYETVCNIHNDGSRRRGILSEEAYEEIIKDPSTIFIFSNDCRIPALMSAEHGYSMGYDTKRCKEYARELSSDVKILTLPVHELTDDEKGQLANMLVVSSNKYALYFSDHNSDESTALGELFDNAGIKHTEKPLVDPRAAKGDEQAALYLYSCCAEQKEDRGERKKLCLRDVQDFYENNIGPLYTSDGKVMTILDMGDRISDQQAEEMWNIFNNRFDFLGECHPISMQDSKEDFFGLLRSDSTMVASTYAKEEDDITKLTCFSFYVDDMNILYWLNQKYIDETFPVSDEGHEHEVNLYTPGVVSSGKGASYAHLPIGLFIQAADKSGMSANMLFENTNLSKRYIPRILDKAMDRSCVNLEHKPSQMVDEISYRLWSIGGEDE